MQSKRQVAAYHSAYVSAQTVTYTVYMVSGRARIDDMSVQLSGTFTH